MVEDGYEFFAKRQLVTLFSAPNYCGEFDNAGALMSVDETLMCSFQILKVGVDRRGGGCRHAAAGREWGLCTLPDTEALGPLMCRLSCVCVCVCVWITGVCVCVCAAAAVEPGVWPVFSGPSERCSDPAEPNHRNKTKRENAG